VVAPIGEADLGQQSIDAFAHLAGRAAVEAQREGHVADDVEQGMKVVALHHQSDAAAALPRPVRRRQASQVPAIDHHRAAAWLQEAGEDMDKGALAASRGPHQGRPGCGLEHQLGAAKRHGLDLRLAVDLVQAACLDRGIG